MELKENTLVRGQHNVLKHTKEKAEKTPNDAPTLGKASWVSMCLVCKMNTG